MENKLTVTRGKGQLGGLGQHVHTAISKKDETEGTSAERGVAAWMGGELGGEWIPVYVWLSPCVVHLRLSQHC